MFVVLCSYGFCSSLYKVFECRIDVIMEFSRVSSKSLDRGSYGLTSMFSHVGDFFPFALIYALRFARTRWLHPFPIIALEKQSDRMI